MLPVSRLVSSSRLPFRPSRPVSRALARALYLSLSLALAPSVCQNEEIYRNEPDTRREREIDDVVFFSSSLPPRLRLLSFRTARLRVEVLGERSRADRGKIIRLALRPDSSPFLPSCVCRRHRFSLSLSLSVDPRLFPRRLLIFAAATIVHAASSSRWTIRRLEKRKQLTASFSLCQTGVNERLTAP